MFGCCSKLMLAVTFDVWERYVGLLFKVDAGSYI